MLEMWVWAMKQAHIAVAKGAIVEIHSVGLNGDGLQDTAYFTNCPTILKSLPAWFHDHPDAPVTVTVMQYGSSGQLLHISSSSSTFDTFIHVLV